MAVNVKLMYDDKEIDLGEQCYKNNDIELFDINVNLEHSYRINNLSYKRDNIYIFNLIIYFDDSILIECKCYADLYQKEIYMDELVEWNIKANKDDDVIYLVQNEIKENKKFDLPIVMDGYFNYGYKYTSQDMKSSIEKLMEQNLNKQNLLFYIHAKGMTL